MVDELSPLILLYHHSFESNSIFSICIFVNYGTDMFKKEYIDKALVIKVIIIWYDNGYLLSLSKKTRG